MDDYRTTDFYTAAFLKARGFQLVDIDRSNARRAVFVFDWDETIDAHGREFLYGAATINARDFATSIKSLKRALYE